MWDKRKFKVAPSADSQQAYSKRSFERRTSRLKNPITADDIYASNALETNEEVVLSPLAIDKEPRRGTPFLQRLRAVFGMKGKSTEKKKIHKKRSKINFQLLERFIKVFRLRKKPRNIQNEDTATTQRFGKSESSGKNLFDGPEDPLGLRRKHRNYKIKDASTSQRIGKSESSGENISVGQEDSLEPSWACHGDLVAANHLLPLHPFGELRASVGPSEHQDGPLRSVRSPLSAPGILDFRKEIAMKSQVDGRVQKTSLRPIRVGSFESGRETLPAINTTATRLPTVLSPEQHFMKEYSEGKFLSEYPFEDNPNYVYLAAPNPPNEAERLDKIGTYDLDKDHDVNFKRIVTMAQCIFQAKTAFISVIQKDDLLIKARIGLDRLKMPRSISLCAHAILKRDDGPFVIPDTYKDWRFARNPAVLNEPFARFYAGAPLRTSDGYCLGTLCVLDTVPRSTFSPDDCHILTELAALATREFEVLRQGTGSRACHINEMFVSQFVQQAPYYKNVQEIFEYVCRSTSKALKTNINFVLEVTSLEEKKFLARAVQGLGELSRQRASRESSESQDTSSSNSKFVADSSGDLKEVIIGSSHLQGGSSSQKRQTGPDLRDFSRHESIRALRLLEGLVQPQTAATPDEKDESELENLTHQHFAELLFPQTRGLCCCIVPHESGNGRLGTSSLFDFQKFCPVGGAEKFWSNDLQPEGDVQALSPSVQESPTMYIIGAFSRDPTVPFTDCQLTCLLSLATALYSAVSHHKTEVALRKSEADVRKEKELLSALVNNILPPVYAERLKADQCAVADRFSNCSILFADIVGFTTIGGKMAADELVGMLNKIFIRFDMIAESLCVEKIKTIGDCYMAATGVPVEQHLHAEIMAEFALAMLMAVKSFNKTSDIPIQIRVGMNSGPVVAGAIGHSKFVYDLWGNAVNIAQRMEAGSEAGRINVSQDTYQLLQNKYRFTPRGRYPVKGSGHMEMYYLEGRRDETRDKQGLLPEEALVQEIEATMTKHNLLGRLNALSQVGQHSSTSKSGCPGLAALVGSLYELNLGGNNLEGRTSSFNSATAAALANGSSSFKNQAKDIDGTSRKRSSSFHSATNSIGGIRRNRSYSFN